MVYRKLKSFVYIFLFAACFVSCKMITGSGGGSGSGSGSSSSGVKYKVSHMLQNLDGNGYTEKTSQTLRGKAGADTKASAKSYTGFFLKEEVVQAPIASDGSTEVKIYYDRKIFTITFDAGEGTFPDEGADVHTVTREFRYGEEVVPPAATKDGASVVWPNLGNADKNRTFTATWDSESFGLKNKYFYLVSATNQSGSSVISEFSTTDKSFIYIFGRDWQFDSGFYMAKDNPTWFKFYHKNSNGNENGSEYNSICGSSDIDMEKRSITGHFYGKKLPVTFSADKTMLTLTVPCKTLMSHNLDYPFGEEGSYTLVFKSN